MHANQQRPRRFRLMPRRGVLGLILLLAAWNAESQQLNFHHYGADAGLPQVQVFDIAQDHQGYLWVGTYGGVGRYNGAEFRNYTARDGLRVNVSEALAVDGQGRVWAGTGAGLCRLDRSEDRFRCDVDSELDQAYVYSLAVDGERLWVGTDRGLFGLTDGEVVYRHPAPEGDSDFAVFDIEPVENGPVWLGTTSGLWRLDGDDLTSVSMPDAAGSRVTALRWEPEGLWVGTDVGLFRHSGGQIREASGVPAAARTAEINGMSRGVHGDLWIATDLGMLRGREAGRFELLDADNGLANPLSHTVFRDREGLLWIGQDEGLTKWVPRPFAAYTTRHGLLGNFVRSITQDDQGRLWLGTRMGFQIVPFEDGDWQFERSRHVTVADGLLDDRVYAIDFVRPGEALVATDRGVVRWHEDRGVLDIYTEADGLPSNQTQAVWVDHAGRVWISTNLGTVFLEDGEIRPASHPELAAAYSFRIREDERGRLWFGTRDRGVFFMEGGEVRQIQAEEGLTDQTIWDISPGQDGGMWVGSNGDGLFHVAENGDITQYTTEDGLADDFVWQVLEDSRGHVWAYTNRGLSRFDGSSFENFHQEDGLLHEEGGATGAWESRQGDLWFASAEGLMRYDPDRSYSNDAPPPVVVENVLQEENPVQPGVSLSHRSDSLDFRFAALSFQAESRVRYRYRLLGLGEEWSRPIRRRPVTFGNLGGGDYVFEVQARNPDGVWSHEPARFAFSVTPPFWQTVWFWVLIGLAAAALVWALLRLRLRQSEARRKELEALVAERTRQLECATVTDPLTGLRNRRFLVNQIETDVAQSQRAYQGPQLYPNRDIVFMMVDLDHFKDINDTYGHLVGDDILRSYAGIIREQLRDSDYVVRWGGEEFLVVARQTEATQLNVIAERMAERAREARFPVDGVPGGLQCTCSIGVSHFPFFRDAPDALSWEQVVDIADTAVYMAKALGRDGWVAIHGDADAVVSDGTAFVRRIKTDLAGLCASAEVRLESSFDDPMRACPGVERK